MALASAAPGRAARSTGAAGGGRARARRDPPRSAAYTTNQRGAAMSTETRSAVLVRSGEGPAVRWGPAGKMRIVAGADSTDGLFSVVEATEEPGSAAPLHIHHGEAEAFYVVEGAIELTCGRQTLTAVAGDFVYAPKDVPHKYAV